MATNYLTNGLKIINNNGEEETIQIPYNLNNVLATEEDIIKILANFNVHVNKINHIDTIKRYNMNSTIKDIESITKIIKGLVYFTALVLENITIIIDTQLLSKDPEHVSKDPEHVTKESEHVSKESNTNKYYIRGVRYITFADVIKIGAKCKELLKNNDNSQISLIRGVLMRVNKFVLRIRDLCNITPCVCIEVSHTKRSFIPFLLVQHLGQLFGAFD